MSHAGAVLLPAAPASPSRCSLTLERLYELKELPGSRNLETLVSASLDQLKAKAFRLLTSSAGYSDWLWSVDPSCLRSTAGGHQVAFTPRRVADLPEPGDPAAAIGVAEYQIQEIGNRALPVFADLSDWIIQPASQMGSSIPCASNVWQYAIRRSSLSAHWLR